MRWPVTARVRARTRTALCCAAPLLLAAAGSCARPVPETAARTGTECAGQFAQATSGAGTAAGRPAPVDEALWVLDGAGTLLAFDGRTNRVTARVDLGRPAGTPVPPALLAGGGLLWVYQYERGLLTLVDPVRARVVRHVPVPAAQPYASNRLVFAHGAVWIAQPGTVWRISTAGTVTSTRIPAAAGPGTPTATAHWLWLAAGRNLVRIDPSGAAASVVALPRAAAVDRLLGTSDGLYASGLNRPEAWVLDPDSGVLRSSIALPDRDLIISLVPADTGAWATDNCGRMLELAPTGGPPARTVTISGVSQDLPAGAALGYIWVGDGADSEVVRVDARTGRILARIPFPAVDPDASALMIVAGQHSVWVLDTNPADGVFRVDPQRDTLLRLATPPGTPAGLSAVVAARPA